MNYTYLEVLPSQVLVLLFNVVISASRVSRYGGIPLCYILSFQIFVYVMFAIYSFKLITTSNSHLVQVSVVLIILHSTKL